MRRRQFVTLLGGAAATWPLAARAQQQPNRMQRIGVLMGVGEGDPYLTSHLTAFREGLSALGWNDGKNVQVDYRAAPDLEGIRSRAAELLHLGPDLLVTFPTPATSAARQASASVPIVFIAVSDPIGPGLVESLPRPGGNVTGFTNYEATMGGKWLELLREIAPSVARAAMLYNPETANAGATGGLYLKSIEAAARVMGTELIVSAVHDPAGIDAVFAAMAQGPGGGVMVMPNVFTIVNRERIIAQAARYRVPTIYPQVEFVRSGGLLCYGVDTLDLFRRAATYADRILKGAKPADLPVQQPTKFEFVINLKTAKALGLEVPLLLQQRADEVIE